MLTIRDSLRSERGVLLVELLVAAVVFSIIALALGWSLTSTTRVSTQNDAQAYLQRQADLIIEEVTRLVRSASDVTIDTLAQCDGGTDTTTLALIVTQLDGTTDCIYATSSGQFLRHRATPTGGEATRSLLQGSPTQLRVISLTRSPDSPLMLDLCGTKFNEDGTILYTTYNPPYLTCQTTSEKAYLAFKLEAPDRGRMNMIFTAAITRRNVGSTS